MIRTNSVELTSLPAAIAYRRKGASGDAAIVIVRADEPQPGIATISKSSGEPILAANTRAAYPVEAFAEAIALTAGMPYHKLGKPAAPALVSAPVEDEPADEAAETLIDSAEYQAVLDAFTDKNGKFSYDLMNKSMIQLAHRSTVVARMVAAAATEKEILGYVVGTRLRNITGNHDLTDEQVAKMAELIDEIDPRGAFKELKAKIREMSGKAKKK